MASDHPFCREEATRTPDPYVPNVVRYQLRYFSFTLFTSIICWRKFSRLFSKAGAKVLLFFELSKFFANYFTLFRLKVRFMGFNGSELAIISRTSASVTVSAATVFGNG